MNIAALILLPAVAVAAAAFTACNSSDSGETITTQQLTPCYAVVTDLQTNTVSYCNEVTFKLDLNWSDATSQISVSGLSAAGTTLPTFTLPELPWSVNATSDQAYAGWGTVKASMLMVTAGYTDYSISNFALNWVDRLSMGPAMGVPGLYWPGAVYSMTIDGRYRVVGARAPYMLFGKTTSTGPDGKSWDNQKPYYQVALDFKNMTADLQINDAQFVQGMPAQNMRFLAVPMTIDPATGVISMAIADNAELIPNTVGTGGTYTPQPDFPITGLTATIDPAKGMDINFDCNVRKKAVYNVSASVNYFDYTKLND